jgi:hypothetical protein
MKMTPHPNVVHYFCTKCGKELDRNDISWLEKSWVTNEYSDPSITVLPEKESQGLFPFGKACAKKVVDTRWIGPRWIMP